jgi:GDPmannose 4,6-dehydratase
MTKTALITGVNGQDGSYLAELLLNQGYNVCGLVRKLPTDESGEQRHSRLGIANHIQFLQGDITDLTSINMVVRKAQPDEVYNLAAQSLVNSSWSTPALTGQVTAIGVCNVLEALRHEKPDARFFQASSSEMFGKFTEPVQTETSLFHPRSPYGVAKVYGHWLTVNYRESFGLHASSGILFNHESPLRGPEFVSRKVTQTVAKIKLGLVHELKLGNIDVQRDWGHARDHVRAMWLMLQQDIADDYIIATGRTVSVRDMCKIAFDYVGLNMENHVVIDPSLFRPADIEKLCGDPTKAKEKLGWTAQIKLQEMIHEMLDADIKQLKIT